MTETLPAVQQKLATVRGLLDKMRPQMLMVLGNPTHVSAIVRVAMTAIQRNPRLLDCTQVSLMGAIMHACQLGLEPDDVRGLAHLVPFNDHGVLKCQLIPGYRGLVLLGLQTEGVHDIYSRLVHDKDEFEYEEGAEPLLRHVPIRTVERGSVKAGYYVIVWKNGMKRFDVMWRDQIDDVKKGALANKRNPNNPELPWNKYEEEMQKKTLLRRAAKTLPQNSRLSQAAELSALGDAGIPQGLELLVDATAVAEAKENDEKTAQPAKAPRKQKEAAAAQGDQPTASPPPASGTASPAPAPPPQGDLLSRTDLSAATLEALVDKMAAMDKWQGEKVSFKLLGERYKGKERVGQLTEGEGQDFMTWLGLQMGDE